MHGTKLRCLHEMKVNRSFCFTSSYVDSIAQLVLQRKNGFRSTSVINPIPMENTGNLLVNSLPPLQSMWELPTMVALCSHHALLSVHCTQHFRKSHCMKYRYFTGKLYMLSHKLLPSTFSKKKWYTREIILKVSLWWVYCMYCGKSKGTTQAEVTSIAAP